MGYYPAFSLSSEKEIQVEFGGIYQLDYYFKKYKPLDSKPILKCMALDKIVSCYMKIIENCLIKIINHNQISFNYSIGHFYPMINLFANIAFNDEYIMKKYILKYMYRNYYDNKDINKFFDERYNFLYLIINNIEKSQQQKSILFLLDCLCEEIKHVSYITEKTSKLSNISIYIKLFNYFLQKNLFKETLFPNNQMNEPVFKSIKSNLYFIFQSIKICDTINYVLYSNMSYRHLIEKTKERAYQLYKTFIIDKNYLYCLSELLETLLELKLENKIIN